MAAERERESERESERERARESEREVMAMSSDPSQSLTSASTACDELIASVEALVAPSDRPRLAADPTDPWSDASSIVHEANVNVKVFKERCPTSGYLMTRPFERECPMPGAFQSDATWLDGMLKPVRALSAKTADVKDENGTPKNEDTSRQAGANQQPKKDKKKKKGGGGEGSKAPAAPVGLTEERLEAFGKCWLCVGFVESVSCVEGSDKLYCCDVLVDAESGAKRQVVTGLQKYVPIDKLEKHHVAIIMNLKPAKLAGIKSEAMILCAETLIDAETRKVDLIAPPPGSVAGDRITLATSPVNELKLDGSDCPKQLSSKVWEKVKQGLRVRNAHAAFDLTEDDGGEHRTMVTARGDILAPAAAEGGEIK